MLSPPCDTLRVINALDTYTSTHQEPQNKSFY